MAQTSAGAVDVPALMAQKEDLIDCSRQAKYADVAHGFPVEQGHARFTGPDTLEVDGEPVQGAAYVIVTGAGPTTGVYRRPKTSRGRPLACRLGPQRHLRPGLEDGGDRDQGDPAQ